jgi:hypothetical protein
MNPKFEPTKFQRDTVSLAVASGIKQDALCGLLKISAKTLRKHFKHELLTGQATVDLLTVSQHVKRIRAGDMRAIELWETRRMGWSDRITVDDGKPADTPIRVQIEYVGEAAPQRVDQSAPRTGLPDAIRKNVQLVG